MHLEQTVPVTRLTMSLRPEYTYDHDIPYTYIREVYLV